MAAQIVYGQIQVQTARGKPKLVSMVTPKVKVVVNKFEGNNSIYMHINARGKAISLAYEEYEELCFLKDNIDQKIHLLEENSMQIVPLQQPQEQAIQNQVHLRHPLHQIQAHQGQAHQGQAHQGHDHQGQAHQGQAHQGHDHQRHAHQGQAHQGQAHQGHDHQGHAHQGQAHQGQAHQEQAHQGHAHQGQAHQGQAHQGQAHQGQAHQVQAHPDEAILGQIQVAMPIIWDDNQFF